MNLWDSRKVLGLVAAGFVLGGATAVQAQSRTDFDRGTASVGEILQWAKTEAKASPAAQAVPAAVPSSEAVQVRGESSGGYPVELSVDGGRVLGKTNGGYPVDLALSREGGVCRVTGKMLGGYLVDVTLSSGRVSGRAMGGYPVQLELKAGSLSGVSKAYSVSLKLQGLAAEGTGVGRFPVRLTFSAPIDDCQFVAVAIAALHRH
jgi:hypothetical protein